MDLWRTVASLLLVAAAFGCADNAPVSLALVSDASDSDQRFETEVYPVLLRDCAMSECHGSDTRFFRVVGPGRVRLSVDTDSLARATKSELRLTYGRARSMLYIAPDVDRSLLLIKPLAMQAGGASHAGMDLFGRNVYASRRESGYAVIAAWAGAVGREQAP